MRRLLLLSLTALATPASGAIDFSPTVNSYVSEGAEYANVSFKDEQRSVVLTLPRLWNCRGDASRLQLTPPNQNFAEGLIQASPIKGVVRFDEPTVKSLEQQVLSMLPSGSQGVALVSQQENPVILNGNLSYEFVVEYKTLGQAFVRSVIVVACPDQLLIFKFSAPKSVFDNLNRSFRQSICSWRTTEPAPAPDQRVVATAAVPQSPTKAD